MNSDATPDPAHAGHAIYSRRTLSLYDLVVLGVSNPWVWRCPTGRILALYDQHASDQHLDVGVGTGWYLDRCRFPTGTPRVGLMDLTAGVRRSRVARALMRAYNRRGV